MQTDLYKGQLAQTKCYFAAGWAEASWRHAEALNQAERHHLDDSALGRAAIHQTEKIHQREMEQANLLDQRNYEIRSTGDRERARRRDGQDVRVQQHHAVRHGLPRLRLRHGHRASRGTPAPACSRSTWSPSRSLAFFFISLWMAVIANVAPDPSTADVVPLNTRRCRQRVNLYRRVSWRIFANKSERWAARCATSWRARRCASASARRTWRVQGLHQGDSDGRELLLRHEPQLARQLHDARLRDTTNPTS